MSARIVRTGGMLIGFYRRAELFRGRLQGLSEGKVRLELLNGDLLEIPLDVIQEARLEFDWAAERQREK